MQASPYAVGLTVYALRCMGQQDNCYISSCMYRLALQEERGQGMGGGTAKGRGQLWDPWNFVSVVIYRKPSINCTCTETQRALKRVETDPMNNYGQSFNVKQKVLIVAKFDQKPLSFSFAVYIMCNHFEYA